jgi:hypothetical protein
MGMLLHLVGTGQAKPHSSLCICVEYKAETGHLWIPSWHDRRQARAGMWLDEVLGSIRHYSVLTCLAYDMAHMCTTAKQRQQQQHQPPTCKDAMQQCLKDKRDAGVKPLKNALNKEKGEGGPTATPRTDVGPHCNSLPRKPRDSLAFTMLHLAGTSRPTNASFHSHQCQGYVHDTRFKCQGMTKLNYRHRC